MSLIDSLTPKDTEEIKPDLFIQKRKNGYRQINPVAWNGKFRSKEQLKSIFSFRTIFTVALLLFLYFGFLHDYRTLTDFYEEVVSDPVKWCTRLENLNSGIPSENWIINFSEVTNGKEEYANSLQGNLE